MNEVKARKRELTDDNVAEKRREYEEVISKAEYRSEVDFFRTLKQKCKKNNIRLCHYRQDLGEMTDREEAKKLKEYLSEKFPSDSTDQNNRPAYMGRNYHSGASSHFL